MFTSSLFINITIVLIPFTIFLLSLIYLLKTYFRRREHLLRAATIVFIVVFLTVILKIFLASGLQYYVWKNGDGVSQYLLPPYQPFSYFLGYSWQHFILSPAIGLLISFLLVLYFWVLNKIFKRQYLDFEDMLILVSGAMIVGWPNITAYLIITFILMMFRILYLFYVKREMQRAPITSALIIAAFLTLLIGDYLMQVLQLGWLKV